MGVYYFIIFYNNVSINKKIEIVISLRNNHIYTRPIPLYLKEMSTTDFPLFDSAFITEPASTYYFHTDYQNNQLIVMPLFVKTSITKFAYSLVYSVQQVMIFFANLFTIYKS
jgi:hypothetical protein